MEWECLVSKAWAAGLRCAVSTGEKVLQGGQEGGLLGQGKPRR